MREGQVVAGKYRVEGLIAWGGMGVVCSALDTDLDRRVALKVLRSELLSLPSVVARFMNEARAAATLTSENIARVLDMGRLDSGEPYLVMEHLDGPTLDGVLRSDGPLRLERAVTFAVQLSSALSEAHARGITHRDVKPHNVVVATGRDGKAVVKLIDFGISKFAKASASVTRAGESLGSPCYMSPEQIRSPAEVDGRTDIWSVGVVLYEMLTGRCPFDGVSIPEICSQVLHAPLPSLRAHRPDVPVRLERLISRCIEKHPARRPRTMTELMIELAPFSRSGMDSFAKAEPDRISYYDVLDDPVELPVRRRWPMLLALGVLFGVFGYAAARWMGGQEVDGDGTYSPSTRRHGDFSTATERTIGPAVFPGSEVDGESSSAAADDVRESAGRGLRSERTEEAEGGGKRQGARSSEAPAPLSRTPTVRRPPRAARAVERSLTPEEVTGRKAAYERYLEQNGLRRVEDLRIRVRPDGTTELLD